MPGLLGLTAELIPVLRELGEQLGERGGVTRRKQPAAAVAEQLRAGAGVRGHGGNPERERQEQRP